MRVIYGPFFAPTPVSSMREKVERLERIGGQFPQVDCPVREFFAPGLYAREMTVPAGVTATGAVHKTTHLSVISSGHCLLTTDDGVAELRAPYIGLSKAGAKRAILAIETTVITTFHPTDETDLDKLVELLTESTRAELLGGARNAQLLAHGRHQELEN